MHFLSKISKIKVQRIFIGLLFFIPFAEADAQNTASPWFEVQGPLYLRENIYALNKAANGWIPWALRNTTLTETRIELSNIFSLNVSSSIGLGGTAPGDLQFFVNRTASGNISVFQGPNSGLTFQSNQSSFDIVGHSSTSGYKPLMFRSGANGLLIETSGKIGIGSTNPIAKLDINGKGDNILNFTNKIIDADNTDMVSIHSLNKSSVLNLVSSRTDAGNLGGLIFTTTQGWLDSHANIAGIVGGRVETDATAGGYLSFWTKNGAGAPPQENLRITQNGNVGIGTNNPDAKLTVKGDIHSREVKVTINAGSDFVFDYNYQLMTLEEVEQFIKVNKHLPDVQSAEEMQKNGLELGKMDMKLLQKVEELTLHMISLKKEIEALKEQNKSLLEGAMK